VLSRWSSGSNAVAARRWPTASRASCSQSSPSRRIPGSSSVIRPRFSSAGGRVAGSIQSTEVAGFQATKSPMGVTTQGGGGHQDVQQGDHRPPDGSLPDGKLLVVVVGRPASRYRCGCASELSSSVSVRQPPRTATGARPDPARAGCSSRRSPRSAQRPATPREADVRGDGTERHGRVRQILIRNPPRPP